MPEWNPRRTRSKIARARREGRFAEALRMAAAIGRLDLIEECALAATRADSPTMARSPRRAYLELRDALDAAQRVGVPFAVLGRMQEAARRRRPAVDEHEAPCRRLPSPGRHGERQDDGRRGASR